MKSGLVVAALLTVHLILGLLQATHLLPADARWFEDRGRREEFREAQLQRLVARARRDIRLWMESPEPRIVAPRLTHSLDEIYYGLGVGTLQDPVTWARWEDAYAAFSAALASTRKSPDEANIAEARHACREADRALEEIGDRLSR